MLSNLNGVVAACAVDKKLAVDVDGDVVNLHALHLYKIVQCGDAADTR